jgi:tRNA(Ile)-lysidine synthetase-like protein
MDKHDKHHIKRVQGTIDAAIEKHSMLEENDIVLVGLSGGKDSFTLLDTLANRKKYYKINFKLVATHVNISNIPYSVDIEFIENFCKERDVEFIYSEKKIDIDKDKLKNNPCFICSWNRRKLLFNITKELKCTKLALGHHKDDAVETFLLNMLYHSSISSLPAKLKMFDGRIHLIRPMIYLSKEDITKYAEIKQYPEQKLTCSYDHVTKRNEMAMLLRGMEILNPNVKENIFKSMSNIYDEYLPK